MNIKDYEKAKKENGERLKRCRNRVALMKYNLGVAENDLKCAENEYNLFMEYAYAEGLFKVCLADLETEICALTQDRLENLKMTVDLKVQINGEDNDMAYIREFMKQNNIYTARSCLQATISSKSGKFACIKINCPLDLEAEMSDGSKLYEHVKIEKGYNEEDGCYCSVLKMDPCAVGRVILNIHPKNFDRINNAPLEEAAISCAEKRECLATVSKPMKDSKTK